MKKKSILLPVRMAVAISSTAQMHVDLEYCPRCNAILPLQKGFSNELPYWVCRGCGEMLIGPDIDDDIIWRCDRCEALLNIQEGFSSGCVSWNCTECGFLNRIDDSRIFDSDDEYVQQSREQYWGMSDYEDYDTIDEDGRNLYRQSMAAFEGVAPTYHIALLEKPTIVWDFHSLLAGIQMMFSFMLTDEQNPLRLCKHCMKVFVASRPSAVFCSPQCKNKHNVYKSRAKNKDQD